MDTIFGHVRTSFIGFVTPRIRSTCLLTKFCISFLSLPFPSIQRELEAEGHSFARIDGSMNAIERYEAMKAFEADGPRTMRGPRFMLCSLRACNTGITLTRANHIFVMDTWCVSIDTVFPGGSSDGKPVHCSSQLNSHIFHLNRILLIVSVHFRWKIFT